MSPPKKRTCARCSRHGYPAASFPEGHLCHRCLDTALSVTGTCPGCGSTGRVLPGLRDGTAICRDCAKITRHFSCLRCGTETGMTRRRYGSSRLCGPCAITWTLQQLLDDGTGTISPPLKPLAGTLAATTSPDATLEWLAQPHIRDLLSQLATGKLPLTHQALNTWPRPRATGYLRDLLISCSALPPADKQLRDYQAWLDRRLTSLASHPHLRILRQFGTWHQLPAMRARAAAGPLRATASQYARTRFTQAETFLTWAAGHGLHPAALTQADIDTYYATHLAHQRQAVRAFLTWAASHGHIPHHLDIPRQAPSTGHAITQQRRLELLRRFATSTTIPIHPRTAACLLLLYAQPLSRILTLTTTDLTSDDNGHSWLHRRHPQPRPATLRHTAAPARRHPPRPHPRQPHQQLAVPRPQRRPARHLPGHAHPAPQPRPAPAHRPHLRPAPARPASPSPRHRRRPRLPPHHHNPPAHKRRRALEPLRQQKQPHPVITNPGQQSNTRQPNTRAHQSRQYDFI
jgi:hypothetical protein